MRLPTDLVAFSIKTKGTRNFGRRVWTAFTRFGVSEGRARRGLHAIVDSVQRYGAAPTFFIPAVVLQRHPKLIAEVAGRGAEVGLHGDIHIDYRLLSQDQQYEHTERAIAIFQRAPMPWHGIRNPYLGWTEDSLGVYAALGITYESNEAVAHDVIDLSNFPSHLRSSYTKSLALFQAIPCSAYTLRPHYEGRLLRIPTSIPDDEMLFDRLRITDAAEVGRIWTKVMQHVYDLGGIYNLNLHPERGVLCKRALDDLLSYAATRPLPVWLARLEDVAEWWEERSQFGVHATPVTGDRWLVEVTCSPRAVVLARHLQVDDQPTVPWFGAEVCIQSRRFVVVAPQCPVIGLSPQTPPSVADVLQEQGYPVVRVPREEAHTYAMYLDAPEGLGTSRTERRERCSELVQQIEELQAPLLRFGSWPDGSRAALAISGDIDSVTVQDFFLRLLEWRHATDGSSRAHLRRAQPVPHRACKSGRR
jgi:peptidoglycan/xylan/chitin deacetylase (PgdA/CDA1 family)